MKYGIPIKTTGIYFIKNKITGEIYVGAAKSINERLSNHFVRDCNKYKRSRLYADIRTLGKDAFEYGILEKVSDISKLLEREQFWYDELKPTYNEIRPCECSFLNEKVRAKALAACKSKEFSDARKKLYSTDYYREKFRDIQRYRMKAVRMFNDEIDLQFESLSECARWLNAHTSFKGKNKVIKIKEVCEGKRSQSYGFKFEYCKV